MVLLAALLLPCLWGGFGASLGSICEGSERIRLLMDPAPVYSLARLHTLPAAERARRLVAEGRLDGRTLDEAARTLGVEGAERMSENVVGVYGLPLSFVPDIPINGRWVTVPLVTEEPSVVAAVSRAAKVLRATKGGITATCDGSNSMCHGMAQLLIDRGSAADNGGSLDRCWDEIERFVAGKEVIDILNEDHPLLTKAGGGCREIRLVRVDEDEGEAYLEVVVNVVDAMGANSVSRYASRLAGLVEERFAFVRSLACIVMNIDDERRVEVESHITVGEYASATSLPEEAVAALSRFAERCPARCYTHNKGVLNGVEAVLLALGQDTRAVLTANGALMHRSGRVQPLVSHRYSEAERCLHSKGVIQTPVGTVGGCLRHQNQAAALVGHLGGTADVMRAVASVALCSNLSALVMLCSPGGIEAGHMPLARK